MGAASASSKKMTEEEVFEILDENEEAFGFPKEMSESIAFSWESNVMKFMSENFKTCIPVSLIFQLFQFLPILTKIILGNKFALVYMPR